MCIRDRTWPVVSERLNRYVKKGINRSATDLSTGTANRSSADDLSGKALTAAATSSDDTEVSAVNDTPTGTGLNVGSDDPEVEDRIRSTLSVKKLESSSALTRSHAAR